MQVLLVKDVDELGQAGEVKKVANGYARNYLFPRQLAVPATEGAIRQAEIAREAEVRREALALTEAQELAQILDGRTVTFVALAGETGRLYGSVTNVHIGEKLEEQIGQEVDRRKIDLEEPLKDLGTHDVTIRLAPEVEAKVTVVIEGEE